MENKKKKGNFLMNFILVIALGVFAFSGFKIYQIYAEYKAIDDEYDAIKEEYVVEGVLVREDEEEDSEEVVEEVFQVDFEALRAVNDEVIGWIRFDEPDTISYPIVQGNDNDKYLNTSFEGKYLSAGAIFVDYQNDDDFRDDNTVIYGHNMKNGSMFGKLKKFRDVDFCRENPYFYIYTADGRELTYQIFVVKVAGAVSSTYDKFYADKEEYQAYIDDVYKSAIYTSSDVTVTPEDRIVTLSTCTGNDETRLVVFGVVVDEVVTGE